jgi:antitoxin component of MazEF toxin-antitoxin module
MPQKLTGAALLTEVDQNRQMADTQLAMRTGYTKQTRSRSGEDRVKPDLQAYYQALLLAKGEFFGLVLPETQRASARGDIDSFKVQKNGAAIIPRRFVEMVGCEPGDYVVIKEGEDGTLLIGKDAERSEAARLEAAANPTIAVDNSEDDEDEEEGGEDDDEGEEEIVAVQQPAIPGVSSTTVRIAQPVS